MKESEFIDLLNLYLDHEISAVDAARLETEVQNHPARRKVYQQYCRMQKACKVLAVDFQADHAGAAATEKKIVAFDPSAASAAAAQRQRTNGFYTVGAFAAAAACIAIIFVGRSRQPATESPTQGQGSAVAQMAPSASDAPRTQVVSRAAPLALGGTSIQRSQATLVVDPLLLTGNAQAETVVSAAVKEANDQLAWIHAVQLAPLQQQLQADQLHFDLPPATLRPEARTIRSNRAPTEASVQMTAFQFVK